MEYLPFEIDASLKGYLTKDSDGFPVVMFARQMNSCKSGPLIRHWHEDFQFVVAQTDGICFDVCDQKYVMNASDCLFINARRIHMASPTLPTGGNYLCINIHPDFLGTCNTTAYRKYVLPFLSSKQLSALLIDGSAPWHRSVIDRIRQMIDYYESQQYGYELRIQALVLEVWIQIISHNQGLLIEDSVIAPQNETRLNNLIQFVHQHYAERLQLSDLAETVQLSQSECCRLVKRLTGVSPMSYLNNYRIYKSANLLQTTDLSITDIAMNVGFSNSGYYTERFKKLVSCTPNEFRRRSRTN